MVLWLGFQIVSGVVHLLVLLGAVLVAWELARRGAVRGAATPFAFPDASVRSGKRPRGRAG
jgi:hypothetical protein